MGLFRGSRFLDRDTEDWHFQTWAWLLRNLGGIDRFRRTPLVTPSREYFPPTDAQGHERAVHVFECVKRALGMTAWSCELVARDRPPAMAEVGEFWTLETPGSAAGTFGVRDGAVTITYASDLLSQPAALVATLAHELAHYLLATVKEEPPGGLELHELATDLTVAFAGFGVFGANSAFAFEQFGQAGRQGWRSQRRGYLSERTWSLALATFLVLSEQPGAADQWLKPGVRDMVSEASRYLAKHRNLLEPLIIAAVP